MQRSSKQPSRRWLSAQLLCMAIVTGALARPPIAAGAEEPQLPSVGGGATENLSIGTYWGLYEQSDPRCQINRHRRGSDAAPDGDEGQRRTSLVRLHSTPHPWRTVLRGNAGPAGKYLSRPDSGRGRPDDSWSRIFGDLLWIPAEPGEYMLCAYLDSAAADHPAEINFVRLIADPAPGQFSLAVTPETGDPERMTVGQKASGRAQRGHRDRSGTGAFVHVARRRGLPANSSQLPGSANTGSSPGTVGSGSFVVSYTFAAESQDPTRCVPTSHRQRPKRCITGDRMRSAAPISQSRKLRWNPPPPSGPSLRRLLQDSRPQG